MPVNTSDDPKVSLRRPHGNGDLDIIWASCTCRKANVTEALMIIVSLGITILGVERTQFVCEKLVHTYKMLVDIISCYIS